jgi:hypothetical protein
VSGRISLGRFASLADLVNHNRSFLVLHDARLVDRVGAPSDVALDELVVNQDDVTFVGQPVEGGRVPDAAAARASLAGSVEPLPRDKLLRQFVIFTPAHAITGGMHVFRGMALADFVEATDPRFIQVSDAVARPLSQPMVVSRFELLLVNRTQISAMTETDRSRELVDFAVRATDRNGHATSTAPVAGSGPGTDRRPVSVTSREGGT